MIVLNPTDETHTIVIVPRRYNTLVTLFLRNENTDFTEVIETTASINNTYLEIELTKELFESDSFELQVNDAQGLNFRGKIFVTAQTDLENYKINTDIIRYE